MYSLRSRRMALCRGKRLACTAIFAVLASHAALAQQIADATAGTSEVGSPAEVPEPKIAPVTTPPPDASAGQDKRILGVLPNYRTADGTVPYQPISWKYKLTIASKDSFDWPNYIVGGAFAGLYMLDKDHPEFGQGVAGFARYYGTSYADQVIGNMLTEGFMPILFHEDPRYFRKVHGSIMSRTVYSLSRVLITKTDSGKPTFNFSEVLGNGIGASIANLYYPDERGLGQTSIRLGTQVATDALSQVLKEFWPDIKRHLHKKPADAQALTDSH
jgi:hypothetical protein